jgi:murein DD-endopeptidase MepM/ murein hydrolase activator NlpD
MGSAPSLQPPVVKAAPKIRAASARKQDLFMSISLMASKRPKSTKVNCLRSGFNPATLRSNPVIKSVTRGLLIGALGTPGLLAAQTAEKASATPSPHPIIDELRTKGLLLPIPGVDPNSLKDTFRQPRGANRLHMAVDIVAARGTPVLSTDSGQIIKIYQSEAGGLTVYATDVTRRFIYFYAHFDRYHIGVAEGMTVARGDTVGYVGTTGNAPENHPHLHFAILRSNNVAQWSRGLPVNPAKVF